MKPVLIRILLLLPSLNRPDKMWIVDNFLNSFTSLTIGQWVVVITFLVIYLIRFMYLLLVTARVVFQKKHKVKFDPAPVSLIMTLRNMEEEIRDYLPAILEIEDLDFEVIVVDDFSQDNSLSVLGLYNQRYGHLKISSLSQETRYSVKLAQNIALKSASNDWVLISPFAISAANKNWLKNMSQKLNIPSANLVIGYSTIEPENRLFNWLYRMENFFQQVKSTGYICNNVPFVYSEENIAFRKEKYFELGGYGKNIQEPYANLELIVNKFIRKKNTVLNLHENATTQKKFIATKQAYVELLRKSIRIESQLPFWKKYILFFDEITNLLFIPAIAAILFVELGLWSLIFTLIALKAIAHVLIIKSTLKRLRECKIFISSLVYGLLMPYYKLFFRWHFNRTSRKYKWWNGS